MALPGVKQHLQHVGGEKRTLPQDQPAQRTKLEKLEPTIENIPAYIKERTLAFIRWLMLFMGTSLELDSPVLEAVWHAVAKNGSAHLAYQLCRHLFGSSPRLRITKPDIGGQYLNAAYGKSEVTLDFEDNKFTGTLKTDLKPDLGRYTFAITYTNWYQACFYFYAFGVWIEGRLRRSHDPWNRFFDTLIQYLENLSIDWVDSEKRWYLFQFGEIFGVAYNALTRERYLLPSLKEV